MPACTQNTPVRSPLVWAGNGEVTFPEWLDFWRNVLAQPDYSEEEVEEELDNMLEGGSWVDWNDGRTT